MPEHGENPIRAGQSAALVINSRSRHGKRLARQTMRALAEQGIAIGEVHVSFHLHHLRDVVQRTITHGHPLVIVGGGDGTFSSIVGVFAYRNAVLGLLPFGTGNSFARTLGIPLTLTGAIDILAHGKVAQVNLGSVNEQYFANSVDLGMTVDVARSASRWLKQFAGPYAYVLVGLRALFRHHPFHCTLRFDGQQEEFDTYEVIVVNGSYYGDTPLPERIGDTGPTLALRTIDTPSRWEQLRRWYSFLAGNASAFDSEHQRIAHEFQLTAYPEQYLNIDGEITEKTPARFSVADRALKVMVPQTFGSTRPGSAGVEW